MTVVAVDVFTVTTTSDTDTNPGNDLTLSEAIADANSDSNPVLIDFAPDVLAAGTYTLTGDLPAITAANVTIEGGGLTLDAAGHRGLFVSSGNVTIDDLIIANAKAAGAAGQNALSGGGGGGGGGAAGLGGGLFVGKDANVTLSDVAFQNDSATGGAGGTGVLPVCIKTGALADNVPARDLRISPNHAMYLAGVLIEAKDLLNGISIVQEQAVDTLEYFHVELDSHDVILAEGALSESFIDDDNRGMFHNAHEFETLYSQVHPAPASYCAPRLDEGYEVEEVRQRLAARAGLAGSAGTPGLGALHGYVDRIRATAIFGWAQNGDAPEAPVCLDIYTDGKLIGRVLANSYRDDLKRAGLGSGRHAFAFTPPAGVMLDPATVEVRRSLDGARLPLPDHHLYRRASRA